MGELFICLPDGRWADLLTRKIVPDPIGPEICDDLGGWKPPSGKGPYQGI